MRLEAAVRRFQRLPRMWHHEEKAIHSMYQAKMTEKTNPDTPLHFRLASAADRPRLITLINAAFAMEDFFDGTRTDEERLAAMMQKGVILMAEEGAGQPLGCVYLELRGARGYLGQLAVDPARQRATWA